MSTIDRAAEVIALALADDADVSIFGNYNDITAVSEATLDGAYDLTAVARALADAGILAPDLPQPTWEHTDIWVVDDLEIEAIGDSVNLEWSDETDDMRGSTTRSLKLDRRMALAILAASNRTKEESNHD